MSDSQLAAFFKKPSTGSVCGRFYEDQLDRSIEIPRKRIPWVKYFFQFALPAFLFSLKASSQGTYRMGKPAVALEKTKDHRDSIPAPVVFASPAIPSIKQNFPLSQSAEVSDRTPLACTSETVNEDHVVVMGKMSPLRSKFEPITIKGKVVDIKNNPIPFATVMIKESSTGIVADSNGRFDLETFRGEKQVILEVSSVGFNTNETMIDKKSDLAKLLVIHLNPNISLPEVIIYNSVERKTIVGASTSVTRLACRKEAKEESMPSQVRLYPNPIQKNNSFNIEFENQKDEKMKLSIVNMSGIVVSMKTENILKGSNHITTNTEATWPAGIYILQLRNEKGQLVKKEKLIVQ